MIKLKDLLTEEKLTEAKNLKDLDKSTAMKFASWKSDVLILSKKLSGSEKKKVHKDINTLNKLVYNITQTFEKNLDEGKLDESKGVDKVLYMADHGYGKLGGKLVDGMSANLFKQVYEKSNDKTKEKINTMNEKQLYVFMTKLWSKFGKQVRI